MRARSGRWKSSRRRRRGTHSRTSWLKSERNAVPVDVLGIYPGVQTRPRGLERRGNQGGAQSRTQNRAQSIAGHTVGGHESSSASTPPLGKGKVTFNSRSETCDYSLLSSLRTTLEKAGGRNQESNHDHLRTAPQQHVQYNSINGRKDRLSTSSSAYRRIQRSTRTPHRVNGAP